ncbi:hypothetical protein ACQE3D_10740 [Methylomonas sp. MS20]|uniref:hypothetical protein n=1 Tax=unclassified Methylomonas TaxID=2608980 RepID=UPI0028A36437|nr:hypothetical protein [Methylomonas sp. MV1]MDT4328526.1 hypothetical protein [Methylomonas sp. MV1]
MSIVIITLRDTPDGVEINRSEVAEPGEADTPATILGAAMYANVTQYLDRHPQFGKQAWPPQSTQKLH